MNDDLNLCSVRVTCHHAAHCHIAEFISLPHIEPLQSKDGGPEEEAGACSAQQVSVCLAVSPTHPTTGRGRNGGTEEASECSSLL